ncbi:hypothetical protein D9M69_667270 [compost metagenome]
MVAESTAGVMVLAVNVISERAADGDKCGAWRHRKKEPMRNGTGQNVAERNARLAGHHAGAGIEGENPRMSTVVDQHAQIVVATVAIAATVTERQEGIRLDRTDAILVVVR